MVYTLDEYVKMAEQVKPKNPKVADPVIADFGKLKETLVVTKGDNYVGAAEPQLREKIGRSLRENCPEFLQA